MVKPKHADKSKNKASARLQKALESQNYVEFDSADAGLRWLNQ